MALPAPSEFHFYEDLFAHLTSTLSGYVSSVASNVISAITPVATTLLALYVVLWGWSMMRGVISEPITDGVVRILRLTFVVALALNLGRYNAYIADFLWATPDALATVVAGAYGTPMSGIQFLDSLLSNMYDYGGSYYQAALADSTLGIPDLGKLITALFIWLAGVLVTGFAAFLYALSKMALAIILAVGPIFVLMLLFEPTKRFFDSWLGQALNYVFMVMLTAAAVTLILTIIQAFLGSASATTFRETTPLGGAIPAIVFSAIGLLVLIQVSSIASALGGGVAVASLGAVGWAYGKAKGGVVGMRPTNLRRSANKIRSDVRIAAAPPKALYRKITGASRNSVAKR
jgi:type IV secretion system protein VirB6